MTSNTAEGASTERAGHEQFVQKAKEIAQQFRVVKEEESLEGGEVITTVLNLLPEPLYQYEDSTRQVVKGVLWAWCHDRNPEALICVEFYSDRESPAVELTNLANARVIAERDGKPTWRTPGGSGQPDCPYWSFNWLGEP